MNLKIDYNEIRHETLRALDDIPYGMLKELLVEMMFRIHCLEENQSKFERNMLALARSLTRRGIIDGIRFVKPDGEVEKEIWTGTTTTTTATTVKVDEGEGKREENDK